MGQYGVELFHGADMLDRLRAVAQEFVEEKQHFFHVCEQILFRLRKTAAFDRRGNTVAHKHQ